MNNSSDFANFDELHIFWGGGGEGRRGGGGERGGAKRKSAPRAPKTLATPLSKGNVNYLNLDSIC